VLKRIAVDFLRNLGWFWLAAVGLPTLAVLILPFVGYSPYGDRPEPGWYGLPSGLTWAQVLDHVKFVGGFLELGVLSIPIIALFFVLPFAVVRAAERRIPPGVVRLLGGILTGCVAWFTIANIGWYISIGWLAGSPGIAAGAFFGARYLPSVLNERPEAAA
jgi:hypothetical protein